MFNKKNFNEYDAKKFLEKHILNIDHLEQH